LETEFEEVMMAGGSFTHETKATLIHEYNAKVIDVLWRQIDLEREKVKAYARGYIVEKLWRMKAVRELRKHEKRLFGKVTGIPEGLKEGEKMFPEPTTPEECFEPKDPAKEDLPWYWKADESEPQPRTPDDPL
jgi:hypothetical protein